MYLLALILPLCAVAALFWLARRSKPNSPPGPPAIPLIGHLHLLINPSKSPPHKVLQSLGQRYGPIIYLRFGSVPVVVASTADAAKEFLKTHDSVFASRPPTAAGRIISHDSDLALAPYGHHWRQLRKLTTLELLTARRIEMFTEVRMEEVRALCDSVLRHGKDSATSPFDVRSALMAYTFNLITFMLMSKRYFGKHAMDDEQESAKFMEVIFKAFEVTGEFPIGDYFPALRFIDPVESRMKLVSDGLNSFMQANISEREKQRNLSYERSIPDFLDVLLDLRGRGETELQGHSMRALLLDLISAGTETSAVTLEWTLAEMITHPEVMAKAQHELDRVAGRDLHRMIEESDIPQLEYLQAIVKESMRLHSVTPLLLPHASMQECQVMGYTVEQSSTIIVNAYAIGRDPAVWEDPEEFRPERFVGSKIDVKGQHFELIPFGAGRRMCPGMNLAISTVHLALANLVHMFDWKEADGQKIDTASEHYGLTLTLGTKLQAIPVCRLT